MSYILDALKKLEHEKNRKSRIDGIVNISGALFEQELSRPSGRVGWKITLAVMVAIVLTFSLTWQFLQPAKKLSPAAQPLSPPQPPPMKVETAPLAAVPPVVSAPMVPPVVPVPVRPSMSPSQAPRLASTTKEVAPGDDAAAELTKQELRRRLKERKALPAVALQTVAAPADIKLSGIAYQDERRARRAVVNGFLLQEGALVAGAVITDIFQDRVRFSLPGGSFEIQLSAAGIPGSGK